MYVCIMYNIYAYLHCFFIVIIGTELPDHHLREDSEE